jgi:hypothetical protein
LRAEGLSYKDENLHKIVFHIKKNKLIYAGIGFIGPNYLDCSLFLTIVAKKQLFK